MAAPDRETDQQPDTNRRTTPDLSGLLRQTWETDPPGLHPTGQEPDQDRGPLPGECCASD